MGVGVGWGSIREEEWGGGVLGRRSVVGEYSSNYPKRR